MIKVICWNARSINTKGSMERLQNLKKMYNLALIVVLEPFYDNSHLNSFRIKLGMDKAACNQNGKIWMFWTTDYSCDILETDEQHITCELQHVELTEKFMISFIYAKCRDHLRRPLWDRLLHYSNMNKPCCTIGDFNVISSIEEKKGGLLYNMNKSFDFISVIEAYGLIDLGFNGQPFTWCNQRAANPRVWKRLDRAMVNDRWLEIMPQTTIDHLPSVGSDHTPFLMEMMVRQENTIKYFKFLHCWVENSSFIDTVRGCWERVTNGNSMWCLQQKLKRLSSTLSNWFRKEYGDIFANVRTYEEKVRIAEEEIINNNTEENRTKLHGINAEYIKFMKLEVSILKQKTQLQWLKEGDANTKYFHALMRGRRRRLFIHKISKDNDTWVEDDEDIATAACEHF